MQEYTNAISESEKLLEPIGEAIDQTTYLVALSIGLERRDAIVAGLSIHAGGDSEERVALSVSHTGDYCVSNQGIDQDRTLRFAELEAQTELQKRPWRC